MRTGWEHPKQRKQDVQAAEAWRLCVAQDSSNSARCRPTVKGQWKNQRGPGAGASGGMLGH